MSRNVSDVTVTIPKNLREEAKAAGLNLSQLLREAVMSKIKRLGDETGLERIFRIADHAAHTTTHSAFVEIRDQAQSLLKNIQKKSSYGEIVIPKLRELFEVQGWDHYIGDNILMEQFQVWFRTYDGDDAPEEVFLAGVFAAKIVSEIIRSKVG